MAVLRGRRLHHRRMRKGNRGHGYHHARQGRHGGRKIRRVPGKLEAPGAGAEVLRLYPLPHPHGGFQNPEEGGLPGGQAGVRDLYRGGDPELHGAHLAAGQERGHRRGVQQVLPGQVPRLRRPPAGDSRLRGGQRHLQGPALRPRGRALRLLHQGV